MQSRDFKGVYIVISKTLSARYFRLQIILGATLFLWTGIVYSQEQAAPQQEQENLQVIEEIKPFRTFITFQRYRIDQNGNPQTPVSNVKINIEFPGANAEEKGKEISLPGEKTTWAIGDGQIQEIDQSFEVPFEYVSNLDGFKMNVTMDRKGVWIKPCKFVVKDLSKFNRGYVCRTDQDWQKKRGRTEEQMDIESIQVRVFTDKNLQRNEKPPTNPIALR